MTGTVWGSPGASARSDLPGPASTERILGGELEGTLTGGQYRVTTSLSIPVGRTLTIEQGCTLRFEKGVGLTNRGTLHVQGTPGSPVRFLSAEVSPRPGSWSGLELFGTPGGQVFQHAEIAHARIGIQSTGGQGGIFRNLAIHDCLEQGLALFDESSSSLVARHYITNSEISGNGRDGILIRAVASGCQGEAVAPDIRGCRIHHNKGAGIRASADVSSFLGCTIPRTASCEPVIEANDIDSNGADGISVRGWGQSSGIANQSLIAPVIVNNLVRRNQGHGIWLDFNEYTMVSARVLHNTIHENLGSGIEHGPFDRAFRLAGNILVANQRGISTADSATPFDPVTARVQNNLLHGNSLGAWHRYADRFGRSDHLAPNGKPADAAGNLALDPEFLSDTDPQLTPDSPARNAGSAIEAPPLDFLGLKRLGLPDLGCYEMRIRSRLGIPRLNPDRTVTASLEAEVGTTGWLQASPDLVSWNSVRRITNLVSPSVLRLPENGGPDLTAFRVKLE